MLISFLTRGNHPFAATSSFTLPKPQKMPFLPDKSLVACATSEAEFCDQISAAALEIGSEFLTSSDIGVTILKCENRINSCIVVDYENANGLQVFDPAACRLINCSMLFVIPGGDVRAAFRSASLGAVNVIEKPVVAEDLIVNLKVALASEQRLREIRDNGKRFSSRFFDELTRREKKILGLLMAGEPNKRVAAILDIGLRTVEGERAQIMKKLNVNSFVELIGLVTRIEFDETETRKGIFSRMLTKELNSVR